jgi:hypothetical protein
MAANRTWIVTASPQHRLADLASKLAGAGFVVEQMLEAIGCITGRADPALLATLRAIDGVADIAPNASVDIGPPDAPIC